MRSRVEFINIFPRKICFKFGVWLITLCASQDVLRPETPCSCLHNHLDNKAHGTNLGPVWGRQDPGGPLVGSMSFAVWTGITTLCYCKKYSHRFPITLRPRISHETAPEMLRADRRHHAIHCLQTRFVLIILTLSSMHESIDVSMVAKRLLTMAYISH